jgi:hypothetical protein
MKTENEEVEAEIVEQAPVLKDIKYPVSMIDINALLEEYAEVPEIDPESEEAAEQYQYVLKGHKRLVKARTSIEKTRKELKAPALEYGKKVDDVAKEFQAKIKNTEMALQIARKTVEDHEQRKLEEAEEAERLRISNIEAKITDMRNLPLGLMGCKSDTIKDVIEKLPLPVVEQFEEFIDKAVDTYKLTMSQLESAYETTIKAEQADQLEAERQEREAKEKTEREAKERQEREKFEAEQTKFREEQRKAQETIRLQQEESNRQNAERDAADLARRQEDERKTREEEQRIANEQARELQKREAAIAVAARIEQAKADKKAKAAKDRANKKLFEQHKAEAENDITAEFTFGHIDALIAMIIAGEVRHVKWVPDGN